ncbi:FtsK/SpoIIIE domain-containing protein [Paenarthrobacter nitroguajacolicus]|uniref:FtsK/SpoIIIE domain-containing protein n=1 Tax=Paenarthrobacter nitroguajacolicus TaxID=211146 RepID=UPI00248C7C3C|nr:FtsK/SpoIIIE domain-containing protein [Paenarthrobacter nitroguajacolicus]MDI2035026.1 hypothetical protein [Paenarthrobacter nitroguajacolicus]
MSSVLKAARNTGPLSVAGQDLATLTVGLPPLVSGAVLVDGLTSPVLNAAPPLIPMLLTHTGPGAGSVFAIQRGHHRIGRGTAGISLPDPGMSREHAVLDVSGERLEIATIADANPVYVDGRRTRRSLINSNSTIRCGYTTFSVSPDSDSFLPLAPDAGGPVDEQIEVSHARGHSSRATVALAAGVPLLAGVVLAAATGMWMYLGFSAMSALGLVFPLLLGRKGRREYRLALDRAVLEDIARRRRCSPSAAEILSANRRPVVVENPGSPGSGPGGYGPTPAPHSTAGHGQEDYPVWLRLGTAHSTANIRVVPEDPRFMPPPIGLCPVSLDPSHASVAILGGDEHVAALLRFIVMQLASFPGSASAPVLFLGSAEKLPLSARYLPQVTLVSDSTAALAALNGLRHTRRGRLVLMESPADHDNEALIGIMRAAHQAQWQILRCHAKAGTTNAVITIESSGVAAAFESGGERLDFVPDLVPAEVFDHFCRTLAANVGATGPQSHGTLAHRSSLAELLPYGPRRVLGRWRTASWKDGLTAVLGEGRNGCLTFNFKLDGPHLLIAGTTGSGKSELLKTLVASIALTVPPEHATFLFFDFKGGSGLGPLAALPHCVGLLTDLSQQHLDRTLESLRGEIKHREKLFAASGAADLGQYQQTGRANDTGLPYLILVIDEFRILVDEAPGALRELMRIATIGRSLGIHLVMATQRPQGALTADIRANVTSSIALRVQSEMESVDIINSKVAASIGVDVPGRAFLATASKEAEEFQSASLDVLHPGGISYSSGAMPHEHPLSLEMAVRSTTQALVGPAMGLDLEYIDKESASVFQSSTGARNVVSIVNEAWQRFGMRSPRSPIAAPLPLSISWHDDLVSADEPQRLEERENASWRVGPVALLDKPAQQRVERLFWSPVRHGHLAMIGSPSSGVHESFRAIAATLAAQTPQPHLYILDANRLLGQVEIHEGIGAAAGVSQIAFAARILTRVSAEMERRRALGSTISACTPLVLLVAGWCSWASALRGGPYEWAEGLLHDIARDGSPLGITLLISGERELVSSRLFAAIPNRAYFPLGTTEESRFHWPRLPEVEPVPCRAVVSGNVVGGQMATAQFREAPEFGAWPFCPLAPAEPPFRLRPLPQLLTPEDFAGRMEASSKLRNRPSPGLRPSHSATPGTGTSANASTEGPTPAVATSDGRVPGPLWIGVAGDEALPAALPLRDRGVSIILGSPNSGKTTVLWSLVGLNPEIPWVFPPGSSPAGAFWAATSSEAAGGNLNPGSILLVDDADTLDAQARQALTALAGQVSGIILTATFGPGLHHQLPLAKEVQVSGMGMILAPGTPHDGELLGVRLQADPARHPGRGFIINRGKATPCQTVLTAGFPAPK